MSTPEGQIKRQILDWLKLKHIFHWTNQAGKLNPLTLTAQLRDHLEGSLQYGRGAIESAIGLEPSVREESRQLEKLSKSDMIRAIVRRQPPKTEGP